MTNQISEWQGNAVSVDLEQERLRILQVLNIIDSEPENSFNEITQFAAETLGAQVAGISFIDADRVWIKSSYGCEITETNFHESFCQFTVSGNEIFEVTDASEHDVFRRYPIVVGESNWRHYVGVPLVYKKGINIGALFIADSKPGTISEEQAKLLVFLSKTIVGMLNNRKPHEDLQSREKLLYALQAVHEEIDGSTDGYQEIFNRILNFSLQFTQSEFGFIGEVTEIDGRHMLRTSVLGENQGNNDFHPNITYDDRNQIFVQELERLTGHTLKTGETVVKNNMLAEGGSDGLENGMLKSCMCLAIRDSNNDLIGIMALANKKSDYLDADQQLLQPFVARCRAMIIAKRVVLERAKIEDENRQIHQKLLKAQSIAKLGNWEYYVTTNTMRWSDELYSIYEIPNEGGELNYKAYLDRLHPEDIERNDMVIESSLRLRKEFSFEERLLFSDGRTKIIQVNGYPILDADNTVLGVHGTMQDITERKRQEEEAQRFFSLAVDLFCIASLEGYFVRNSRSINTVLGYNDDELHSTPFLDFVHPEDRLATQEEFEFILRGGTSRNFENRYRNKKGEYISLSWTAIFDEESQLVYAAAQDITQKRELESRLLESRIEAEKSKAKDIFLANMSHEIRTPLNAIIGFNDILSQTSLTAEQRRNVEFIGSASKRLSVLINDILDISKLESGKLDLELATFRLEEMARGVIQMYASKAKAKGIKLLFSFDPEIPEVLMGDETRLSQILINLISNAIKFTEHGSVEVKIVQVSGSKENVNVLFEVKDTGIGIPEDKREFIFERFTQAETYTTRIYGGTGLGLNIVRSLVELHHGKLELESEPDKGSAFRFSIEYAVASEQDVEVLERPQASSGNNRLMDMRILLVEDNEHNQILAETYLLKQKAVVEIAPNGKVAIELLKQNSYDAIIMDIQMPIMDGLTTTSVLRDSLKVTTPVIACSAHAMTSERAKCREVGMNDYISKPFTEELLVNLLAKYRKADSQIAQSNTEDFAKVLNTLEKKMSATYVQKIVGVFKQRLPGEIESLQRALEARDYKLIEERAHYTMGSLSSLKFDLGYKLSSQAERAAAAGNYEAAQSAVQKLIAYLQELLLYLNTSVN